MVSADVAITGSNKADVDASDKGTPGTTCTGTLTGACGILDRIEPHGTDARRW